MDGMQRMLDFLDRLEDDNTHYFLTRYSPDGLTATFTVAGARVEVLFTPNTMTYSYFEGNEDVLDDPDLLEKLMKGTWQKGLQSS